MDIVYDLYRDNSIKSHERDRRGKVKGIATDIYRLDQSFPVAKYTNFGLCPKITFPFNRYSSNELKSFRSMTAVLSSSVVHMKNIRTCVFKLKTDPILSSDNSSAHGEANDRVKFHVNYAVKVSK